MINANTNRRIVRASALYDLLVTAPFMTPWSLLLVFSGMTELSDLLGLDRPIPTLDATQMLLGNLLGSVVIVWSLWRWRQPTQLAGRYDALARGLFALWQVVAVAQGASVLILGFTLMELLFGLMQWVPVSNSPSAKPAPVGRG